MNLFRVILHYTEHTKYNGHLNVKTKMIFSSFMFYYMCKEIQVQSISHKQLGLKITFQGIYYYIILYYCIQSLFD